MSALAGRRFVRFCGPDGSGRLGTIAPDDPTRVVELRTDDLVGVLVEQEPLEPAGGVIEVEDPETLRLPAPWHLLAPIRPPEVWAAGVTYERSRDARLEEAQTDARDVYALVYEAERPELFMKDACNRRTVGPGDPVAVRSDATWTVPEPELGLVLGPGGKPVAVTIGNDVSSRDIEGANPLYLPQAKIYANACALGPAVFVPEDWSRPFALELRIRDSRGGIVWEGATTTERMRRRFDELAAYVCRDNPLEPGTVLLTGTGIVPPDEVSLESGQSVEIRVDRVGTLVNPVVRADEL
jgi:2-dehydro-3-deoxy-D-arabinonate dehydratase